MEAILLVVFLISSSTSGAGATSCFVPAASAVTAVGRLTYGSGRTAATQLSLASSKPNLRGNRKFPSGYIRRIPIHQEEAAGITVGLGLWKTRRQKRQIVKEKWNSLRVRMSGRRRKRLALRLRKYLLSGNEMPSSDDDDSIEDEEEARDSIEAEEEEAFVAASSSLDAMRARSGVLRTRIRFREESLKSLETLTRDVRLEMKRMEWKNAFDANAGFTERTAFMYGQEEKPKGQEVSDGNDTGDVMNEFELMSINEKWKNRKTKGNDDQSDNVHVQEVQELNDEEGELVDEIQLMEGLQLDRMNKRAAKLENSILLDRIRLQRIERRIVCCESGELGIVERAVGNTLDSLNDFELETNPITMVQRQAKKFVNTFGESTSVLLRKIDRVSTKSGANNRDYASVTDFVVQETAAGVRIVGGLLSNPSQLQALVDPDTPSLVPHVPAILARLDRLESHVAPILSRVLSNKQHLRTIEPYLDEVLERFDDIEPHLPWILDHVDTLAPYTGLLLKHIDELLLYALVDEYEAEDSSSRDRDKYAFAEQLLPYLEVYVSQLDLVGPHLPLLRPHLPLLLKHNRIKILSPHVGVLFNKGYKDLSASANMDILLFYFGWALRIPFVPFLFFSFPGSPRMVSFLANRLPKRLVRGRCYDVTCYVDGDYGEGWNELSKLKKS